MGVQGRIEQEQFKRKLLLSSRGRREHCAAARDQVATVGEGAAAKNATSLKLRSIEHMEVAKRRARETTPAQLRRVTQKELLREVPVLEGGRQNTLPLYQLIIRKFVHDLMTAPIKV